jgi:hypothetical protein
VNLTETPLDNPCLGVATFGNFFSTPLLERGFANNPDFGGGGPVTLSELPANGVYATLVDSSAVLDVNVNVNGSGVIGIPFNTLDVFYLTPVILILRGDFDGDLDVDGRDFLKWQRGESFSPLSAGDLADWQANFGVGMLTATSVAVPEPGACLLLTLALCGILHCRIVSPIRKC